MNCSNSVPLMVCLVACWVADAASCCFDVVAVVVAWAVVVVANVLAEALTYSPHNSCSHRHLLLQKNWVASLMTPKDHDALRPFPH